MPSPTQLHRTIAVGTPLGDDVLLMRSFKFTERLGRPFEMVLAEAVLAFLAVDEHVVELFDVSAGDPHIGMHDDAGVQADHVAALKDDLEAYEISKGTIRFPLSEPVPVKLIARIAKFRAQEVAERHKAKAVAPAHRSLFSR